jgi:hypothetical protein
LNNGKAFLNNKLGLVRYYSSTGLITDRVLDRMSPTPDPHAALPTVRLSPTVLPSSPLSVARAPRRSEVLICFLPYILTRAPALAWPLPLCSVFAVTVQATSCRRVKSPRTVILVRPCCHQAGVPSLSCHPPCGGPKRRCTICSIRHEDVTSVGRPQPWTASVDASPSTTATGTTSPTCQPPPMTRPRILPRCFFPPDVCHRGAPSPVIFSSF